MRVVSYSESDRDAWDSFVFSHESASVGHHSSVFEFEKEFGGENISLLIVDGKNTIVGILPLFFYVNKIKKIIPIRTIRSGSSLRNGPLLSDKLSEKQKGDALDLLMITTMDRGKTLLVDDISISYPVMCGDISSLEHFEYFPLKKYGFVEGNKVAMIKDLRCDEHLLLASLRHNCRKNIRRCEEEGGEFIVVRDRNLWMSSYDLNVQTLSGGNASPYTQKTMEMLWDCFVAKGVADITAIRLKGKIISILITTFMNNSCYPWIGFNSKPSPIPGSNNLLTWKTMLYFKSKGVHFFEIGSREFSDSKQINISAYKESFQGRNCYCLDGKLIFRPLKDSMLKTLSLLQKYIRSSDNKS